MRWKSFTFGAVACAALFLTGGLRAQDADDASQQDPRERLRKILRLMEEVEGRLVESDTGDFTQDEQTKIVEAMKFEDKTSDALEKLIRDLEKKQGGS